MPIATQPKVLHLAHRPPHPPDQGDGIRDDHVAASEPTKAPEIRLVERGELSGIRPQVEAFLMERGRGALSQMFGMLSVLRSGLGHDPLALLACAGGRIVGVLPLAHVRSALFGRFLVSLPYANSGGVVAEDEEVARRLIDAAVDLANRRRVRYLELRHEQAIAHPALTVQMTTKVHMRLKLPRTAEELWDQMESKVRNQVRKGMKNGLIVAWGGEDLLDDFYRVFSHNMRDLGTPVYGRGLFQGLLREFGDRAEICLVRADGRALASALLLHGQGVTEVPSASSLRRYNHTNANMLLYWQLLVRAVDRGQELFDFGRSSGGSNTHRFKKQWGAVEVPAVWQYHLREGSSTEMRPDNEKYRTLIRLWKHTPVWLANLVGPVIVRGIP
jgi:FemAB-related protein (PEP-CTERM system-associated)